MEKNAYILTKEGRVFNQDGIDYVLGIIRNRIQYEGIVDIRQGAVYNNKEALRKLISKEPENSYIFVSFEGNVFTIWAPEDIEVVIEALGEPEFEDLTSWETMMKIIKNKKSDENNE